MSLFGIVYRRRHLQYAITDAIAYLLSMELGFLLASLWGTPRLHFWEVLHRHTGASLFLVSSTVVMLYLLDGFRRKNDFRRAYYHLRIWTAVGGAWILALVTYGLFPHGWWGPWVSLAVSVSLAVLLSTSRFLLCVLNPAPASPNRTVLVGNGRAARLAAELLRDEPEYALLGFVAPPNGHPRRRRTDFVEDDLPEGDPPLQPVLGDVTELTRICSTARPDHIVVAYRGILPGRVTRDLLECKTRGATIEEMPTFHKRLTGKVPVLHVSDDWLIYGPMFVRKNPLVAGLRRLADVVVALMLGVPALPVVALSALAIRLESRGSPFFLQERLGRDQRPFVMYKLRTMRQDAEERTGAVWSQGSEDPRVTRVGRFLRRTRIDELPQLYNVLRGDMSLVGPRPEREHFVSQLKEQIPFYALRFAVKPGLTGWAQVNYRYGASVEDAIEKLRFELYEIQELTPALYFLILLRTVQTVLLRSGS